MRIGKILLVGTAAVAAVGFAAAPAAAAPTDTTVVSFDIEAGTLDILAPATADIGGGPPGTDITGTIGPVTVTDSRASDDGSWVASVISTDFTTGAATPSETILASEVEYWSGESTATTGDGTFEEGQTAAGDAEVLDNVVPVIAFTHTGGTGNNSATWNPSLIVHAPLDSQAGTYTGTVTHSVA
ncbi:hypothetical protein [Micromonospora sp. NBC_01796]|uniref:hypothetical protein n=1 Tax=Micromonospora sp. NBC_01796 TaxID=2975987 RepID=UPI002DD7B12E|nr:hypothetical protein [Micromonospora sp. NBC_01796]WSA88907.1 hypothetical protein OIE47_15570 [Micromonospora sp. NBC_01796]